MCLPGTTQAVADRVHDHPTMSRRSLLKLGAAAGVGALAAPVLGAAPALAQHRRGAADLTHVLVDGFPVYTFDPPSSEVLVTIPVNGFYAKRWVLAEHSGTHVDSPGHFVEGNRLVDELTPDDLMLPVVAVDITARAATDPDAEVTISDLRSFERRYGRIPRRALVCMYSGWDRLVGDPLAYRGDDADGVFHFPGFGADAVEWLLINRDVAALGVDTLSLDHGPSTTFDVHLMALGADRYGIENLANLGAIPPRGARVHVGVIPFGGGSGAPCRVTAAW